LHKILSTSRTNFSDALPPLSEEHRVELRTTFSQPFYFLGHGGQCYAFVSADGRAVLKFFKQHHIRFWKFLDRLPLPSALEGYRQKILSKKLHQSPAFFESCKIAYLQFRERTGLIYLHLQRTDYFNKKLTLIDNLGIAHQLDLDSIDFALQKKAEPTRVKLRNLIKENDLDAAKQCIKSLLVLITERSQKGICDRDPNLRRNIGFVGNQAIEIDLGSYTKDESLNLDAENIRQELIKNTWKLKQWLDRKSPVLSLYLSEQIDEMHALDFVHFCTPHPGGEVLMRNFNSQEGVFKPILRIKIAPEGLPILDSGHKNVQSRDALNWRKEV
jgi:hypothetical protein